MPDQRYKPTGRPPGRPRKDGLPKANENPDGTPKVRGPFQPYRPPTAKVAGHPENVPQGHPKPGPFPICSECHPSGWPKGWTAAPCEHGVFARPWAP